uniref:Uncharacterized protein n=1 Tax=viral metagenome TaxID=1070528 RepID=A0A6C0CFA3_9ZZZZ
MAFHSKIFQSKLTTVTAPVKASGEHDYVTLAISYGTDKFTFCSLDSVTGTKISENSKKPGQLTQGFHLETKESVEMLAAADTAILEGVLKHRGDKNMPEYVKDCESVEELLKVLKYKKYKPLLHRPKKKGADGKPTKEVDMTIEPLVYGNMIQCGPKHPETPNKVFTKYVDVRVLSRAVRDAIKAGTVKESDYSFEALDLFKRKLAMKCKYTIVVGDVFISDSVFKIRRSIQEVFVVGFEQPESLARKEMSAALEAAGEKFEGPKLSLPDFVPQDEPHSPPGEKKPTEPVVENRLPAPEDKKEFKVQIVQGNQ